MLALTLVVLGQTIVIQNEGTSLGQVRRLNCSGSGITCSVTGHTGTLAVSGGGPGGEAPAACASGQALTSDGDALVCTAALKASEVSCLSACVDDSEITAVSGAKVSGAVATATALAANPTACSASNWVTDIAADGALTCAQPAFSDLSGSVTDAQVPNNITVTLAATATALANNPTDCVGGQYATAIDASGNLTCDTPAGGGGGPTKLANDVAVAVSASYVTVFTVTGATIGNSKNAELFFRVVHEATANTIGMQYRVSSADTGYVGRCHFIAHGIAGTAASATGHEADTIAIAAAPADNAAAASCAAAAPCLTEIMCVLRSDASAGNVLLEAQLETGTASAPVKAGSTYYTLTTN